LIEGDKALDFRYREQVDEARVNWFFDSLKKKNIQIHETKSEAETIQWLIEKTRKIFKRFSLQNSVPEVIEINDID
jgi:hypothetical protein